jgi:flagellar hook-associated protein FlgK
MAILVINKMNKVGETSTLAQILQFIKDCLPMIGGIIAVWKTIDEVAKWWSKKQEVRLKELIKTEVNPQMNSLTDAINDLREEIGKLKDKIKS